MNTLSLLLLVIGMVPWNECAPYKEQDYEMNGALDKLLFNNDQRQQKIPPNSLNFADQQEFDEFVKEIMTKVLEETFEEILEDVFEEMFEEKMKEKDNEMSVITPGHQRGKRSTKAKEVLDKHIRKLTKNKLNRDKMEKLKFRI